MACEFRFGERRENISDFYSGVFRYLACAVECGMNPKYIAEQEGLNKGRRFFEYLRYEHVGMLVDAIRKVCKDAEENVKSRDGKLSFESVEEMERYQRDAIIVKKSKFRKGNFGDNVILAIDGIPKNRQAYMLRGLAMYIRFFDEGDEYKVTERYMLTFADYLLNVLVWICDNKKRVWRTRDLWANLYGHDYDRDNLWSRREFLSLPDYYGTERAAFVRAGLLRGGTENLKRRTSWLMNNFKRRAPRPRKNLT